MTNLEWLNEIGMITTNRVAPNGKLIGVNLVIALRDDDFKKYSEKGFDWLLEEHKEPIKLTKFEYDLLESLYRSAEDRFLYMGVFKYHAILRKMKSLGHFKGVKDDDMTLAIILDNCEVVE